MSEEVVEGKEFWVVYSNTDLTEGRGHSIAVATCEMESTAIRLSIKRGVMGTNADVEPVKGIVFGGQTYIPSYAVKIDNPSKEDIETQKKLDAKRLAFAKAKAAGLTDDELKALGFRQEQ